MTIPFRLPFSLFTLNAIAENIDLMSADDKIRNYDIDLIWGFVEAILQPEVIVTADSNV